MKKHELMQSKKRQVESAFERIERIKRVALRKLGINLTDSKAAKIAMDSFMKEAKAIENIAKNYRSQVKIDSAYNDASRLYGIAESISKTYAI